MNRRAFLGGAGVVGAGSLAGCTGLFDVRRRAKQAAFSAPPLVEDRPDAVYYPTHVEKMKMVGMKNKNGYACALTYTYPHRFWLVTGTHTKQVEIETDDSIHVMPIIWDVETGQRLPDVQPKLRVKRSGESVLSDSPWPMLAQPMGWHFGDNLQLPDDDTTYEVTVHANAPSAKRTGRLRNPPLNTSFTFSLEYSRSSLEDISWHKLDKKGERGAVSPMRTKMIPASTVPKRSALPGTVLGTGTSGDATVVVTALDDASRFGGSSGRTYLAVSPRTPYNRYLLPMMDLSLTQRRGSRTVTKGDLTQTLDPELGLHYGSGLDGVRSGDQLTIHVETPPQFARHEGYETAFVEMNDVTVTA